MRLGDVGGVVAIALARDLEGARSGAAGRMGLEHLPRLPPPHLAVVRLEAAEPARIVRDLARAADLVGGPGERIPDAGDEAERSGHGDERSGTDEAPHDVPPSGCDEPLDGNEGNEREHGKRADHHQHAEQPSIRDTIGPGGAVLDDGRSRKGPAGNDDRRAGCEEPEQRGLDAAVREDEHQGDDDCRRDHACARLREQDHERGRVEQRERRPAGRSARGRRRAATDRARARRPPGARGRSSSRSIPSGARRCPHRRDRAPGQPCRAMPRRGLRRARRRGGARATAPAGPGSTPAARPTRPKASRTMAFARASQERSPAIDHQMLRPVHATRPIAAAAATMPARSSRGSATRPRDQPTTSAAATRIAAVPSGAVASVPEAPPAKKDHATSTPTAARTTATRPDRFAPEAASMARHGTTRQMSVQDCEDLQFVYPELTSGSTPAGRLATLLGNRAFCPLRIVIRSLTLNRALRLGLLLIALVMVSTTVGSKPAMAKAKSCADLVIADWYDDGRVSKIYPLHCYREAIAGLPPDVLDYSNAKEEIGRALAFAKQGKPDPGGSGPRRARRRPTTTTTEPVTSTAQTTTAKTATTKTTSTPTTTTRSTPTPTRPRRSCLQRILPDRPRCRCRCSSSVASPCCFSQPAQPDTSAAG